MDHSRRHLLRATLLVAAAPRVHGQQQGTPPVTTPPTSVAGTCGVDDAFVDHAGWIIPCEARLALLDGLAAPREGPARLPPVEAGESGADSSATQVIRGR